MRLVAALVSLLVGAVAHGRGVPQAYKSIVDARYIGKRVYWLQAASDGSEVPLSAVIGKVLIPEVNDDTIAQGNASRMKFVVYSGQEYRPNQLSSFREHAPRFDKSITRYGFRAHRRDEEKGLWGAWQVGRVQDEEVFYRYDKGKVGYTIDVADVIPQGFMLNRTNTVGMGELQGMSARHLLDVRVHFQQPSSSSTPEHYAGMVAGLARPSEPGRPWRLRVNQLSAASALDAPRVFAPNETLLIEDSDIVGQQAPLSHDIGAVLTYGHRGSRAGRMSHIGDSNYTGVEMSTVTGRVLSTYSSGYWEMLNYTRVGMEGVIEPYLYLIDRDDLVEGQRIIVVPHIGESALAVAEAAD